MLCLKKILTVSLLGSSLLFLSSCEKYYVSVAQQWVDVRYLASTHVNTPDPRQLKPPVGQMIIIDWRVPKSILKKNPHVELKVIYWNYTEKTVTFPIDQRMGWATYKVLDEEYDTTGGILTYKAEILTADGQKYREWKHQLLVNLITIDNDDQQPVKVEERGEDREVLAE